MQLLHIDSAITGDQSVSRQLTARTVDTWIATHPGTQVQHLDLAAALGHGKRAVRSAGQPVSRR